MIGYWKDQFGNRRKFLSCSLFDGKNDVVQSFKPIQSETVEIENIKRNLWEQYMNPSINLFMLAMSSIFSKCKKIIPNMICRDIVSVQPMKAPEFESLMMRHAK